MTANQIHVVTRIFIVTHTKKLIVLIVILIADQNTQTNSNTSSFSKLEN